MSRCRDCARLVRHLAQVRAAHPDYHCAPVPATGPPGARLVVVGLAPGLHGANRTGRPFEGDDSGVLLRRTLRACGFTPGGARGRDPYREPLACRITNAVKCLPPGNRPLAAEVRRCSRHLAAELQARPPAAVVLALGRVAHAAVLRALSLRAASHCFAHGALHRLESPRGWLLDSYHCSRYNTRTGRLTPAMLMQVIVRARELVDADRVAGCPPAGDPSG